MAKMCEKCEINSISCLCTRSAGYTRSSPKWPKVSITHSCTPETIKANCEEAARRGVSINYKSDGTAYFDSPGQERSYNEAFGFWNRDGGYSDARQGEFARRYGPIKDEE